ncbi:MAG: DNA ligase D [Burkholderiales bacterium]|nr:DNA ligase D [Burkholderiales bacterium]
MALERYWVKRDFSQTPEPRGGESRKRANQPGRLSYVIQKHAARRLHYDFRLELNGVLLSWAVPKGPSLDPKEKRLAVHVEDHPLEYGGFEGIIPPKQYGSGTVLLWDRGVWQPEGSDVVADYQSGKLKFRLDGEKLHGRWTLVRMGGLANANAPPGRENWLLIKENDETAQTGNDAEIVERLTASVASGLKIEEIAADPQRVWHSNKADAGPKKAAAAKQSAKRAPNKAHPSVQREDHGSEAQAAAPSSTASRSSTRGSISSQRSALPAMLEPELATRVDQPPDGPGWIHEIKLDGYRMLCRVENGTAALFTRNGNDWTHRFPTLAKAAGQIRADAAWLDGEIAVLRRDGTTSFQDLQNILTRGSEDGLVYYLFDALYIDGRDVRDLPLIERKALLADMLASGKGALRYSDHVAEAGAAFFRQACEHSLEGIVSKRADSVYRSGRGRDWLKVKCARRQEFVIGGYTDPAGSRTGFGALLLGLYDESRGVRGKTPGELRYAGRVGTGFDEQSLRNLHARLKRLDQKKPAFSNPPTGYEARGVHWVAPELVAEIAYGETTAEGIVRHASFQGLREDKAAYEVVRETSMPVRSMAAKASSKKPASITKTPVGNSKAAAKSTGASVAGVRLTHPDRVLYPENQLTKLGLAQYYEAMAPLILPHLAGRPLSLVRCPDGSQGKCFYQKHANDTVPAEVDRVEIPEDDGKAIYTMANSLPAVIGLVQMGVLELHTWGSKSDRLDRPDRIIFDLDPDIGLDWKDVVEAAKLLHLCLQDLKLESFLKTTGGKGLHIVAPIARRNSWDEVKAFSKAVAEYLVRGAPEKFTSKLPKAQRKGKIYIDYLRNGEGATAIAAYSTRARPGAPISAPLHWSELGKFRSDEFDVQNIGARLGKLKADPWQGYDDVQQALSKAMWRQLGVK